MIYRKLVFWRHKAPKQNTTGTTARLASTAIFSQPNGDPLLSATRPLVSCTCPVELPK
jgi:hypothetical protein